MHGGSESEGLIEYPVPNEPARKAPVELFDQDAPRVAPVPLHCALCGRRFRLPPWDPMDGALCPPDEGGCGAITKVSR